MTDSKLRWRCRRGTRELDTILLRFVDRDYPALSAADRATFEDLLDQQDPDLADWILGGRQPPDQWVGLVARIRAGFSEG